MLTQSDEADFLIKLGINDCWGLRTSVQPKFSIERIRIVEMYFHTTIKSRDIVPTNVLKYIIFYKINKV